MRILIVTLALLACASQFSTVLSDDNSRQSSSPGQTVSRYASWKNGPIRDERYFPIAVWLQSPKNAARYKAAGINLYVGLWRGPTAEQLRELRAAGMNVFCSQNQVAMEHLDDPVIVGWMHGDEPDNAQPTRGGQGYGPPIPAERIVADYERIRAADPNRPVLLNLGQGVAWDNWIGRGVRRNHPEDYPGYIKGSDIVSFDIYPVVHDSPDVTGKLEFVAKGVERLVDWSHGEKIVWNCIECTHISNPEKKATPEQVRTQVWMALIHGSRGLIYFVHEFKPAFNEAALLDDPTMLAAITALNLEVHSLAPVLNSSNSSGEVTLFVNGSTIPPLPPAAQPSTRPIAWLRKHWDGAIYLFTVNMRNQPAKALWTLAGAPAQATVEVLGEDRRFSCRNGTFADDFTPYQVHLYRIRAAMP